ncbi:MAG: hypothetical protein KME60_14635 [Cyanomargarita calcarea GSE-NOS-MK-12-04C]|uniref:Uncharacterized protein n=1 Tax=Cyanomargarita calcarea GSE-NOS-MK-12-04C TaxID=2839659 RepID=A0A951QQ11_9CYAN|nr:hypothetical protein [Cyanomargarita calcarea GSE-NOS-MK-12-04C]
MSRYERGWHYPEVLGEPSPEELSWIGKLSQHYGSWLTPDSFSRIPDITPSPWKGGAIDTTPTLLWATCGKRSVYV